MQLAGYRAVSIIANKWERKNMQKLKETIGKAWSINTVRNLFYVLVVAIIWQVAYIREILPPILFHSVKEIGNSLIRETLDGSMLVKLSFSMRLIVIGIFISVLITIVLTVLAMYSKSIKSLINTLISVFDPLPGIALLPVAILWFGIGTKALIFIMIHSIIWPMLLNITGGFNSVPTIYQEVGRSIGLKKMRLITGVYIPASVPSILTGFKTGWSRAWRALISAEMVFGATGAAGGLGWDIYTKRSYLDMPGMFASLIVIMIIGILVEDIIFKRIENNTVKKWGMVS